MTYLKRHVFLTTVMLSAINVALPASAEKDGDNKVHFVAAFATKTQYKLPQKQSAAHHKFKVQIATKTQDLLLNIKRIAIFAQIKFKF